MLKEYKTSLEITYRLAEILIIVGSFMLAIYLKFGLVPKNLSQLSLQFKIYLVAIIFLWLYFSHRYNLYSSKRYSSFIKEMGDVIKTAMICIVLATIPAFFLRENPLSRLFLLYLWPLQIGSLILWRYLLRNLLRYLRLRGYNYRQILIVGCNGRASKIVEKIRARPEFGLKLLGFIDDPTKACANDREQMNLTSEHRVIGDLNDLESILRTYVVDEVFVTLPIKSFYEEIENIIQVCEQMGVEVKISTDIFNSKISKSTLSNYGDVEFIDFYTSPKMTLQIFIKRTIDITFSIIAVLFFLPLFLIIAIAIKMTSKGPVFFIQKRIGYNGRTFDCLKFRTMVPNAEQLKAELERHNEMDGPVFKIKNDPRLTKVGGFLRNTSLDEFPQLINVLRGDMSLVGPRPPVPEEVCHYKLPDCRRLSMRPGITCIWQISGRNDVGFEKWMEMDRKYIDEWSLWLDCKILAKTIPAVLMQKGAH